MTELCLISPDLALCHALQEQGLGRDGGTLVTFASVAAARAAWATVTPQAVLVDDGALAAADDADQQWLLTQGGGTATLLFVLGAASEALATQADEVFPKPLRLGYLLTRLQFYRQARRVAVRVDMVLGPFRFAPWARAATLAASGEVVKLTDKEASLLDYLCQATGPLARDAILAEVWGYDGRVDTHTLETHIYRLRHKLAPPPGSVWEGQDLFLVERGCYRINPLWLGSDEQRGR